MIIVNTEDYNIEEYPPRYDQYYNYYKLENKETGETFQIKTGIQSAFSNWYNKNRKTRNEFFVIIKNKYDSYYKIRNPHSKERAYIKNNFPEYFI